MIFEHLLTGNSKPNDNRKNKIKIIFSIISILKNDKIRGQVNILQLFNKYVVKKKISDKPCRVEWQIQQNYPGMYDNYYYYF